MATFSPPFSAGSVVDVRRPTAASDFVGERHQSRARAVITIATAASIGLFADLLLVGHTNGEELGGLTTAALGAVTGGLSLVYLAGSGNGRLARLGLYVLWLTVAFFGFDGYSDHRLPPPEGSVDSRTRPPLAPLIFTGFGVAGALSLRSGTKER